MHRHLRYDLKTTCFLALLLLFAACSCKIPPAAVPPPPSPPPQVIVADVEWAPAKNIILLIGDGMGLAQITAGMYLNGNYTALEKFPVVGIHKSHSANNLVTDSGAGATAFSCGVKANNGGIGVDATNTPRQTILQEADKRGMATGMIVTSSITHATPAAFIAHVPMRNMYEEIAKHFLDTDIDLMIGGGAAFFKRRSDGIDLYAALRDKGYTVADYLGKSVESMQWPKQGNFAYFTADREPLPYMSGRDYFVPASKKALDFLKDRGGENGFFLMIEGAQIDWGGHANDIDYIASEYKEFDEVVELCLDFAMREGNTLVIVTSDHEAGGLAINPGSTMQKINAAFTTDGHTAVMIPVFAYGPGAHLFGGIYDNTAIYYRMRQSYGWQ